MKSSVGVLTSLSELASSITLWKEHVDIFIVLTIEHEDYFSISYRCSFVMQNDMYTSCIQEEIK